MVEIMLPPIKERKRKRSGRFASMKSKRRRVTSPERQVTESQNCAEDGVIADCSPKKCSWREGRRIVELGYLVDQLKQGCVDCKQELNLTNTTEETIQGLGSILYVQCANCSQINSIKTGKTHRSPQKKNVGCPIWDINTKAATGQ